MNIEKHRKVSMAVARAVSTLSGVRGLVKAVSALVASTTKLAGAVTAFATSLGVLLHR